MNITIASRILYTLFFVSSFLFIFLSPSTLYAATASVTASPDTLFTGGEVTVTWTSTGAFKCVGTGFSTGDATSGSTTVTPTSSGVKTYSVTCYDDSPACTLNEQSSFVDDFPFPNTCTANISYSPSVSCYPKNATCTTGQSQGSGFLNKSWKCEGSCTTVTASDSVTVNDPPPPPDPSVTLSASPATVTAGNATTISWSSDQTTSCNGDGFSTNGATSGSVVVTPTAQTNYSISCDSEVFSSVPGTWEYQYTDFTDLWCPLTTSIVENTWSAMPTCPTSNVQREGINPNYFWTNDGDPTGLSCTGSEECKINSAPNCTVNTKVYRCNGGVTPNTVVDSLTVFYNDIPNRPTITGPTSGVVGVSYNFSFTAIDPNSDSIRYQVDWDDDGSTTDSPGGEITSYSSSGWIFTGSQSWSSPGVYTFEAYTRDIGNAVSSPLWSTHTISISDPTPQCSDGVDNDGDGAVDYPSDLGCTDSNDDTESPNPQCSDGVDNDGDGLTDLNDHGCSGSGDTAESPNPQCSDGVDNDGNGLIDLADTFGCDTAADNNESTPEVEADVTFDVSPELVRSGSPVTVSWSVTDVTSCTVAGSNGDNWSGTSGNQTSSNITAETTFVIACTETDGDTVSLSQTVKLVPSFEEVFRVLPQTLAGAFGALITF